MNKMFALLVAGALAGCTAIKADPAAQQQTEANTHPRFMTETPYGLSNLYEETSAPQLYSVVAARATNKMLDQITEIYEKPVRPKMYVMQIKKAGAQHVPDGFYYSRRITKEIISGSKAFTLVNTQEEADYVLDIYVSRIETNDNALEYKMVLTDKNNNEVGSWKENIRQVRNDDRSWW